MGRKVSQLRLIARSALRRGRNHRQLARLCLLVVSLGLTASQLHAEVDALRLQALDHYALHYTWDNVNASVWVKGVMPTRRKTSAVHTVCLAPGHETVFRVPPLAVIRVQGVHQKLAPEQLELWVSNGTGLFTRRIPAMSTDGESALLVPDSTRPCLARVRRPWHFRHGIEVALFTSRLESPAGVVPYQEHPVQCARSVEIRAAEDQEPQLFFRINSAQPRTIPVQGPARFAIETRYIYPPTESRSFQTYRLRASLNGTLYRLLEYETGVESNRLLVGGRARPLGRRQVAYLEIPEGEHQLQLDATASVFVRLMSFSQRNYLLPRLNQPPWLHAARRIPNGLGPQTISSWNLTPSETDLLPQLGDKLVTAQEQLAQRSARDNYHGEGGLRSMMLMRTAAALRPDDPRIRHAAQQIRGFHTFFRNLLPVRQTGGRDQRFAWFHTTSPRQADKSIETPVIAQQHIEDLIGRLSNGFFSAPGDDPPTANLYRLPDGLGTTFLRIAVDRRRLHDPTRFMIQYDQRPPIELEVRHPHCPLETSKVSLALAALRWQHGTYDHGTLGGPFSRNRAPGPLIPVATAELLVPHGVREVRVWAASTAGSRLGVALQYRASKPFRLSESEFMAMQLRTGLEPAEVFRATVGGEENSAHDTLAVRELVNHWLPFARYLRSKQRSFEAQVVPPEQTDQFRFAASREGVLVLAERARQLVASRNWLPGLEAWSAVLADAPLGIRSEALFARTEALQQLGEVFLADRTLRGLYLYDDDSLVRATAFEQLRSDYLRSEDPGALEQLLATAVATQAEPESLDQLTDLLLENGDDHQALVAALVTPATTRSSQHVLRATYRLAWWDVFQRELEQVPDPQRHYWTAMRELRNGDYERALSEFRAAGTAGMAYARHLELAQRIHADLQSERIDERVRALFAWEQWQASHPGPRIWQEAGTLVKRHDGTDSLYSMDRGRYAQFYRARRLRPVVLRVLGPQDLRLECRPVHAATAQSPRDDWIHVKTDARHLPIAVNANRPSTGLNIVGDPDHLPGRKIIAHFHLGPGLHEVSVYADELPLLVRVFSRQPELPIGVLPPLTPDTLDAAIQHGFRTTSASTAVFQLLDQQYPARTVRLVQQSFVARRADGNGLVPDDPLLAARLALRTTKAIEGHAGTLSHWVVLGSGPAQERALALARLHAVTGAWCADETSLEDLPRASFESMLMARQRYTELLALPLGDDASVRRRMMHLLWLSESNPDWRRECQVRGQRLRHNFPLTDGLAAMHARLTRGGGWSRVKQVSQSAGVRKLHWPNWVPESPSLRVRRSLIAPLGPEERLLFGHDALVLSMRNLRPARFELSLTAAVMGNLPMQPMRVACQHGELPPRWISVSRGEATQYLQLEIPAGSQYIRIWIEEPIANHYIRLGIREILVSGTSAAATDLHRTERIYDVATHEEPVRLDVDGPAWLRIDEFRDDETHTRYLEILEPHGEIELTPDGDQVEALLRVFRYQQRSGQQVTPPHWVQVASEPLPAPLIAEPWWDMWGWDPYSDGDSPVTMGMGNEWLTSLALFSPDSPVMTMDVYDPYPLDDLASGTWSLALGAFSRRPLEEGLNGRRPGQFLESRATRYYGNPSADSFQRTDLLARARDRSGSTFGLLHRARRASDHWPVDYELLTSAYAQEPAGAIAPATSNIEWATTLRGRVLWRRQVDDNLHHTLRLSVFGRLLSQDRSEYPPELIDQDIFTTYKATHLTGMTFSDTWVYRGRVDTRWWIRPSVVTNEDYNLLRPDQLNLRCGWDQAFRRAELAASYRLTWFFDDRDRSRGRFQNLLYVDLVTDLPFCRRQAELLFRVQHDLDRGAASAQVSVAYFFDRGHLDRDRWPGERTFHSLRKQHEVAQRSSGLLY